MIAMMMRTASNHFTVLWRVAAQHPVGSFISLAALVVIAYLGASVVITCYHKYGKKNELIGGERSVMLTFDDGPDPEYTEPLLDVLAVNGVNATFFLLAEKANCYPQIVDRMIAEGHQVAFHALNHRNMWLQTPWSTRKTFRDGLNIFHRHGWNPRYYRPPFGNLNPWTLHYMRGSGLELQLWSVMAQDWRSDHTSEVILSKLRERTGAGSVICLHDSGEGSAAPGQPEQTIRALESFLPQMRKRGFQFVLPGDKIPETNGQAVYRNALQRKAGGVER